MHYVLKLLYDNVCNKLWRLIWDCSRSGIELINISSFLDYINFNN